ncbi:hypothetical protein AC578_5959 [Pseudocercospora eumusae]|uniref:Glycine cleavage system H protein n=1 Tax=Pseudocercospora eumusae TaxID=321146 RepID=A0A139HI87_9PEZI|nr:hypothetical protein AC578_5959 [Pseudocercospora eumusae]KXT02195.1 hypothetical protein AC578_5959 [Pseudocercospora eumusae]
MASAVAGRAFARSIASSSLARCSRPQYLRLRAQQTALKPARSFSGSATAWVKKYTEDHEWVELSEDGSTGIIHLTHHPTFTCAQLTTSAGTIGISEYAAKALGDVVFVELPTIDLEVGQGESIGAVESVKSASDIMTPISGTIIEANSVLEEKPGTINKSPEADGWLAKIKVSAPEELDALMDADGYKKFTEEADNH